MNASFPKSFRRVFLALATGGLLAFSGCESAVKGSSQKSKTANSVPADVYPRELTASIGGFAGASWSIEMRDKNTIIYSHNPRTFTGWPGTKREVIHVPEERWRAFRRDLDQARVWNWRKEYINRDVVDGTVWTFKAVYADRSADTRGKNAFPNREQFEKFKKAVSALLGGREFQ